MPDFRLTEAEVASATEYLLTLTDENVVPSDALPGLDRDDAAAARGASLFRSVQCDGCHRIGEEGADMGRELTRAGRRLRPAFMAAMIRGPKSVVPETVMKVPPLEDRQIADLVAFLERQR
jgi:cytochrome c2